MCTDLRLVKLPDRHVSARTLDFNFELRSRIQVVPRGQSWTAIATGTAAPTLTWENGIGFIGMDAFGFDWGICDGLNEAGLSIGTLWLPETKLPLEPPDGGGAPAIDFVHLAAWILGTCETVDDVRSALAGVQIWNAPVRRLWPADRPVPDLIAPFWDAAFTEHLSVHDSRGGDLVVEFLDGTAVLHDNPIGVLTNSPTYDWHVTNLSNYLGLTTAEVEPMNLMGMKVSRVGHGTGLRGLPGDVTPPTRFVRAVVATQATTSAKDARDAANQAFHCLDLVSVPRYINAEGDYTQWYVARDHDEPAYYVRSYDGWATHVHRLAELGIDTPGERSSLPLPAA
ncbi:MAG: linear amide C-N hydrolase [Actinobacteria bacterium]|nr:linear amide C-N hydrolase [Actinomycetota bacterium]